MSLMSVAFTLEPIQDLNSQKDSLFKINLTKDSVDVDCFVMTYEKDFCDRSCHLKYKS